MDSLKKRIKQSKYLNYFPYLHKRELCMGLGQYQFQMEKRMWVGELFIKYSLLNLQEYLDLEICL